MSLAAAYSASPGCHLACRVAVEVDTRRARDEGSQIHDAPGVGTKGRTQHAPLNGRSARRNVGGNPAPSTAGAADTFGA